MRELVGRGEDAAAGVLVSATLGRVHQESRCGLPAGADVQFTSGERRAYQRNLVFGIANGAFLMLGDTLIHPTIVLALFVSQISDSNLLVGLVPVLATGVWFLPQLVASGITQGRPRTLIYGVWASIIRAIAIALLGVVGFLVADQNPSFLLVAFFVLYTIYNLAAGFANVPMVDVMARAVPGSRLAFLFGQRNLWGGVLGFMAGFLIERILSQRDGFPANYAFLFFLSFLALAVAAYTAVMLQEPPQDDGRPRSSVLDQLRAAPSLLANEPFRRFLAFRAFLSVSALADPFYVVYVQQQLGAPTAMIGVYISAMTVARFGSNLFWTPLANRRGNRIVLQLSALLRMGIPILALALPPLLRWSPLENLVPGGNQALYYVFALVFVFYGMAIGGQTLANMTYLLDIAPEYERPTYVGLVNTILGVVAFVPIIGGTLVDLFGFQFLFLVAFLIAFAAVLASGALHEPRISRATPRFARSRMLTRSRRVRH